MLTADGLSVKVSLSVYVRTVDARRWHEAVDDADGYVYTALQLALREAVAARSLETLLTDRRTVPEEIREGVAAGLPSRMSAPSDAALRR